jgi:hypothetical protein
MKISATDTYQNHDRFDLDECNRQYCGAHRLLWRDCETLQGGMEGDRDVVGGTRTVYELGDCPTCERAYEMRQHQAAWEAHQVLAVSEETKRAA